MLNNLVLDFMLLVIVAQRPIVVAAITLGGLRKRGYEPCSIGTQTSPPERNEPLYTCPVRTGVRDAPHRLQVAGPSSIRRINQKLSTFSFLFSVLQLIQYLFCSTCVQVPQSRCPCINTVQQLFEFEQFRFRATANSIVNQFFNIRHEIRKTS
jgi:hypothetical protein